MRLRAWDDIKSAAPALRRAGYNYDGNYAFGNALGLVGGENQTSPLLIDTAVYHFGQV